MARLDGKAWIGLTPTYRSWSDMLQRCTNPNNKSWPYYGGRGIKVCKRWRLFRNFLADMGTRAAKLTLDRINNDGNYEPKNCRWATRSEQNLNKRKRTHCRNGHPLVGKNRFVYPHGKAVVCRTCLYSQQSLYRKRMRAEGRWWRQKKHGQS